MRAIARIPGWRPALHGALEAHRGQPFAWGSHDCGVLVGDAVLAMTGFDPAAPFRGRYRTAIGAALRLVALGHVDHVAYIASLFPEVHPSRARVGDIAAVLDPERGFGLGIVNGATVAVLAETGLAFVPLSAASRAFQVG